MSASRILQQYDAEKTGISEQELEETLDKIFTYQKPTEKEQEGYDAIKEATIRYAQVILTCCPPCEDRWDALKMLRELRMKANSSIALKGEF